jgi:formylglycine-generating enzyme required for sulfatase activity
VLVESGGLELVWEPLRPYHFYRADTEDGYDDLYRRLTDQPAFVKPPLGEVKVKPPRNAPAGTVAGRATPPLVIDPRAPPASELAAPWSKTGEDRYGHWAAFAVKGVEQRMRWILPGRFWMGSPPDEEGRWDDEGPRHEVELTRGFWLGEVPCTQALWKAVMGSNPSLFRGAERPVEQVSWEDCQRFLAALERQRSGLGLRLPTESEWEYGARAGTSSARYQSDAGSIAWYDANSGGRTHAVGGKAANAWGLHDMLGNVCEWCQDFSGNYSSGLQRDPGGPSSGSSRVVRGGSWYGHARNVRAAVRDWDAPSIRHDNLGFRLARGQSAAPSQSGGGAPSQ